VCCKCCACMYACMHFVCCRTLHATAAYQPVLAINTCFIVHVKTFHYNQIDFYLFMHACMHACGCAMG